MTVYPLRSVTADGKVKTPTHTLNNEEYISQHYDFWLTDEFDDHYRLHSRIRHSWDDAMSYDLKCPKCGNILTACGAPRNHNDLCLYVCKQCAKH